MYKQQKMLNQNIHILTPIPINCRDTGGKKMDTEKEMTKLLCDKKNLDITNLLNDETEAIEEEVYSILCEIEESVNEAVYEALSKVYNQYHNVLSSNDVFNVDENAFYGNDVNCDSLIEILIHYWR